MSDSSLDAEQTATAWNPGLSSDIPGRLLPQTTLYRPENALVCFQEAKELSDLTGLPVLQLVALKTQRLVLHELLVRVTADLSVPDDQAYEVLGINLRQMVSIIEDRYISAEMSAIEVAVDETLRTAETYVRQCLADSLFAPQEPDEEFIENTNLFSRVLGLWSRSPSVERPAKVLATNSDDTHSDSRHRLAVAQWQTSLAAHPDESIERHCLRTLIEIVESIVRHRGRLLGDQELIVKVVVNRLRMSLGAKTVANLITPLFDQAVDQEAYRKLPAQDVPLIMNVKGASASGKSTIRPQQRVLAQRLGIAWEDFALISPDYWRKSLLDYESLGPDYLYGAMLTGQELAIIDAKLDSYMASKASRQLTTHLLIDRFRFDSFVLDPNRTSDSTLLTRFGRRIFMFFMITPPTETVERAWKRGLKTGRYKAVDDLLYHNIEAYKGMPDLFFSWVNAEDKTVHFEFLDNDVPEGTLPRTVAYGWNGVMTILLPQVLMNIDRYTQVNTSARTPEDVLSAEQQFDQRKNSIVELCANRVERLVFARVENNSVVPYALVQSGELAWWDADYIRDHVHVDGIGDAMQLFDVDLSSLDKPGQATCSDVGDIDLQHEQQFTVGCWEATPS